MCNNRTFFLLNYELNNLMIVGRHPLPTRHCRFDGAVEWCSVIFLCIMIVCSSFAMDANYEHNENAGNHDHTGPGKYVHLTF